MIVSEIVAQLLTYPQGAKVLLSNGKSLEDVSFMYTSATAKHIKENLGKSELPIEFVVIS